MGRYSRHIAFALFALPALWSCGSSTEPEVACDDTTRSVDVSVTVGEAVAFDWSPRCAVYFVLVEPLGEPDDVWGLITEDRNGIMPPVTFGESIVGTETIVNGALIAGQSYTVAVARLIDGEEVLAGTADFVR